MATPFGAISSFITGEMVSFVKSKSSSSAVVRHFPVYMRSMTISAASKPATGTENREPRGIMKPRRVSPEMQAFLGGVPEIPRTQALKEIWAYIKQHGLQVHTLVFSKTLTVNTYFVLFYTLNLCMYSYDCEEVGYFANVDRVCVFHALTWFIGSEEKGTMEVLFLVLLFIL